MVVKSVRWVLSLVQHLQRRMRRRERRAFGGVPRLPVDKGNNKKGEKKYCSILFLSTNASPLISFSLAQHLQKRMARRRRRREGWAFGGAPIALANKRNNKKGEEKLLFYFIFIHQHLTSSLLLSGPPLTEEEKEEEAERTGSWW